MPRTRLLKLVVLVGLIAAAGAAVAFRYVNQRINTSGLLVEYGGNGLQKLSYNGVVLEDLATNSSDGFHIWHMKMTDLDGRVLSTGQYGWGENNISRSWDMATHAWTYRFIWGTIVVRYAQTNSHLDITVTERNNADSGVVLGGATIYPLLLHRSQRFKDLAGATRNMIAWNGDGPSVTPFYFGKSEVVSVVPEATKPLYTGFVQVGQPGSYAAVISGTSLDQMPAFQTHADRPVAPGESDSFTVSLRFAPADTDPASLAQDAYANWRKAWPPQLKWPDRRVIGTVYLASSPSAADPGHPAGYSNNPRRYFNHGTPANFDVRTQAGLLHFQEMVLRQANETVAVLRRLDAQGAVTWDIEGEEYPQETSYVCAPDQIAQVAPEMESLVLDSASPYVGMKLADAWFKTQRDAGFRVGVCVRPQRFLLESDGSAHQVSLPDDEVAAELLRKMRYAHDRWGATLFYIDSSVRKDGSILNASILEKVAAALPDSLLIPEQTAAKAYAYTAPFQSFLFHGDLGTNPTTRHFYRDAFSVNLINDVSAEKLRAAQEELTQSVRSGDVLMAHAGYWQQNNDVIVEIYTDARKNQ